MTSKEVRQKYLDFFKKRGHKEIIPAKLVLENDPTTLFVSAGMQPLIPYLKGETHTLGKRLVDSQPCFRSQDITGVGDNRHTTFFEMLGNWSLGDYFKKEQLEWLWQFLTEELKLSKEKLHVSIFEGDEIIPKDEECLEIWKGLGVAESHFHFYGNKKNWWSPSGTPENMKEGEIGGPDSEVFFEFDSVEHDPKFGKECHPNCDCGRFLEIANSVFIEYIKKENGSFEKLPQKNVDFGGGLERLVAAANNNPDIFESDLYLPLIKIIEENINRTYSDSKESIQIIADHIKSATFLIISGVIPSNKLQGYVLRRLIRRTAIKVHALKKKEIPTDAFLSMIADQVLKMYEGMFGVKEAQQRELVIRVLVEEVEKFGRSLEKGLKEIEKIEKINSKIAFDLYQTFGFPLEITEELFRQKGQEIDHKQFEEEFKKHQDLSRTSSAGIFKGGLAGHSEIEIKYHTATHLLHQVLRDVLGSEVFQKGSNITPERLRFDFSFNRKMTEGEIKQVEELVNQKIKEDLKVERKYMTYDTAKALEAIGLFDEKYDKSNVSIYCIGPNYEFDPKALDQRERGDYYSLEFCGGPHVEHTNVIGGVKILKEEAVSEGVRRIRAVLS